MNNDFFFYQADDENHDSFKLYQTMLFKDIILLQVGT